ncbi:MAG: hypothetical protein ACC656_08130 [Candidatus Heimdallarchaeota archaeon]
MKIQGNGDCFDKHGRDFLFNNPGKNWQIVHGIVINSTDMKPMNHCWLEKIENVEFPGGNKYSITNCVDKSNGNDVELVESLYYFVGKVQDTKKYDLEEYQELVNEHGTWGPWEIDCGR